MRVPGVYRTHAIVALVSVLLIVAGLAACNSDKKMQKPVVAAVPVVVATAEQKSMPVEVTGIGSVEPFNTVGIKPMVSGEIKSVNFKEGQDVSKGQLLFAIDRAPMDAALHRAQATLARDEANAANDRAQAARYESLFKAGVVSKEQTDQMMTAADASAALVKADKAAVDDARVQLQYATLYSPISGRTGSLMVRLGNVIKANPDNPIVTINQIAPIYVTFTIPEQYLSEVKRYMAQHSLTVRAAIPNDPKPAIGHLTFIDNAVDTQTGTIKMKGTFENSDHRLWPGQFVNVTLTLATQPNAITVPQEALQTGQQGQFVYVVRPDNTAEFRPVTVARTVEGRAVIASGVQAGDRVVTDGQLRIRPGESKLEIQETPVGAPAPSGQNAQNPPANQEARK
jgi:membrane fusion protein, multidrug efflux system